MPVLSQRQQDQYCCAKTYAQTRSKAVNFKMVPGIERSKHLLRDVNILRTEEYAREKSGIRESELWAENTGSKRPLWKIRPSLGEFLRKVRRRSTEWEECDSMRLSDGEIMDEVLVRLQGMVNSDQFVVYKTGRFDTVNMPITTTCIPPVDKDTTQKVNVKITFTYYALNEQPSRQHKDSAMSQFLQSATTRKGALKHSPPFMYSMGDAPTFTGIVVTPRKCFSDFHQVKHSFPELPDVKLTQSHQSPLALRQKRAVKGDRIIPPYKSPTFKEAKIIGVVSRGSAGSERNVKVSDINLASGANSPEAATTPAAQPAVYDVPSSQLGEKPKADTLSKLDSDSDIKKRNIMYESVHSVIAFNIAPGRRDSKGRHTGRKSEVPFFSGADYWRTLRKAREAIEETWHLPRPALTDPDEYLILDADDKPPKKNHLDPSHFNSFSEFLKYKRRMQEIDKHEEQFGRTVSIKSVDDPKPTTSSFYTETLYGKFTSEPMDNKTDSDDIPPLVKELKQQQRAVSVRPLDPKALNRFASVESFRKKARLKKLMQSIPEPTLSRHMLAQRLDQFLYESYLPGMQKRLAKGLKRKKRRLRPRPYKQQEDLSLEPQLPQEFLDEPTPRLFDVLVTEEQWKKWMTRRVKEFVVRKEQIVFTEGPWPTITCITFSLPLPTLANPTKNPKSR